MKHLDYKKGFTLIEMSIIIGILIVLVSISASALLLFNKESDLSSNAEEIISALRQAQNKSLASEGPSRYGVYFNSTSSPNQYILFKGLDYVSRDPSFDDINDLPDNIEIYEIDLDGGNEVVFERITGIANQVGKVSLRLKSNPAKTKSIYIENSGRAGLIILSIPTNSRIEDSRHVHFDLGWSIQGATSLKFNFVNASQIETIDMADYFNADKTEFDWEGVFIVSGVDQVFRVHTHSLDAFNTLLCIHRDRNNSQNTEEVIISIIDGGFDKNIAHYLADTDDTVIEEAFGGTKEIQ